MSNPSLKEQLQALSIGLSSDKAEGRQGNKVKHKQSLLMHMRLILNRNLET